MKDIRKLIILTGSVAVFIFLFWRVSPMLIYAEGWNTFYFDSHIVADEMNGEGILPLITTFMLQFFHTPWHGIVIMALFYLIIELMTYALLKVICRRISPSSLIPSLLACIISISLAISTACNLSKCSVNGIVGLDGGTFAHNRLYMQLSNMAANEDWDGIINLWHENMPETNLLNQNIINMAMAEKGMLHAHLMDNTCMDINSIYVSEIQSGYIAAMLSDVYYSMGHIAQAQRYAFEANEKMDNKSPRMLQRLVKTNLIYGQYAVARKYLDRLSSALYYADWCDRYYALLGNRTTEIDKKLCDNAVETDAELGLKRRCLNIENKFSGFGGLDKDLLQIARATRGTHQSTTTVQYLSALFRLARYEEEYNNLVKEYNLR